MGAESMATVTASTKRFPGESGNRIGDPETSIASFLVTPFQSVRADLALEAQIRDPREAKLCHCFVDGGGSLYDVREGDLLVVGATEYTIRSAAEFNRPTLGSYTRLIVEERKVS